MWCGTPLSRPSIIFILFKQLSWSLKGVGISLNIWDKFHIVYPIIILIILAECMTCLIKVCCYSACRECVQGIFCTVELVNSDMLGTTVCVLVIEVVLFEGLTLGWWSHFTYTHMTVFPSEILYVHNFHACMHFTHALIFDPPIFPSRIIACPNFILECTSLWNLHDIVQCDL